jgi:hypothetical protein
MTPPPQFPASATPAEPIESTTPHGSKSAIEVRPVQTRAERRQFINLIYDLYVDDPAWVPPLLTEQRHNFSARSPYFQHAKVQLWVAYRAGRPVGRIAAQVDELRIELYHDATGHFGAIEAIDDPAVFAALLGTAEAWLRAQGMRTVVGPFNLSINGDIGCLVEGFDVPPVFLTGHGKRYYGARIEEQGYHKAKDVVAYRVDATVPAPRTMIEGARRARESSRIRFRPVDMKHLKTEMAVISGIFNDAWANNWGFVPFTEAEFAELGDALRYLVPPEFVQIAEVDGEPAAMLVIVPNLNEFIADLHGRLLPFGWLRLVFRVWRGMPRSGRVALMGVRRKYQHSLLTMGIAFGLIDAVRQPVLDRQMQWMEMGWVLEDNFAMLRIMRVLGGQPCKTYRVYEKALI